MPIPSRISPDFLKDTIVEIRYRGKAPYPVLIGAAFKILIDLGFKDPLPVLDVEDGVNTVTIPFDVHFLKENVRVTLKPGSIVFNFHEIYPCWDIFSGEIKRVLSAMFKQTFFKFYRLGLRYVNSFDDINVFDIINPNWRVNLDGYNTSLSNIKTEIHDNDFRVILNLGNGYIVKNVRKALIDIDVISESKDGYAEKELFDVIENAHEYEKNLLFKGLLKEEYVQTREVNF